MPYNSTLSPLFCERSSQQAHASVLINKNEVRSTDTMLGALRGFPPLIIAFRLLAKRSFLKT